MREYVSWLNDELVQIWPILLLAVPAVVGWWRKRDDRKRTEMLTFVRDAIDESATEAATAHAEDIGVIREQVANSHDTNLRHDMDEIRDLARLIAQGQSAHLDWSQEWTSRVDRLVDEHQDRIDDHARRLDEHHARIAALEAVIAAPTPPAA